MHTVSVLLGVSDSNVSNTQFCRLEHKKMRKRIQVFWTSRFGYREVGSRSRLKGEDDSIWGVEEDSGNAGVKKSGNGFGGSDKEAETKDISKKSERV